MLSRSHWLIIRDYVIGWTLAFVFLSIIRGVGTTENGSLKFDFLSSIILSFTLGPILGSISGYAQILMEERYYKRMPMRRFLGIRLAYAVVFLVLLIVVAYGAYQLYFGTNVSIVAFAFDDGSFAIYFYILVVDFFMVALRQVNLMLGGNNLGKLLSGRFYHPRDEKRIFMFIDLQSSTSIAEKLGHIKYSTLIQDCFNDLGIVSENEAEIYQYVGDEVILTWKHEDGLRNGNCLNAFYHFKELLSQRADYYEEKYQCKPFFKAGLHAGIVTVTEVGKHKKEIAYHGDTINTAARIQGMCNDYNKELLISKSLKDQLPENGFAFEDMGSIPLKGKQSEVHLCSVSSQDI